MGVAEDRRWRGAGGLPLPLVSAARDKRRGRAGGMDGRDERVGEGSGEAVIGPASTTSALRVHFCNQNERAFG